MVLFFFLGAATINTWSWKAVWTNHLLVFPVVLENGIKSLDCLVFFIFNLFIFHLFMLYGLPSNLFAGGGG